MRSDKRGETVEVKFRYKFYRTGKDIILAVCDSDIIGKVFEEGDVVLYAKEEFYGKDEIGEEVVDFFRDATIINLLGNKIVELALTHGWIEEDGIIEVKGVKHAQIFKI